MWSFLILIFDSRSFLRCVRSRYLSNFLICIAYAQSWQRNTITDQERAITQSDTQLIDPDGLTFKTYKGRSSFQRLVTKFSRLSAVVMNENAISYQEKLKDNYCSMKWDCTKWRICVHYFKGGNIVTHFLSIFIL